MSEQLPRSSVILAVAAGSALLATAWPLLTYTVTLALFGLPHVLAELRYVDERFGLRLRGRLVAGLGLLLGAIVVLRLAGLGGFGAQAMRGGFELVLVAGLVVVTLPVLARGGSRCLLLGGAVIVAVAAGAVRAPLDTLVVLAILHNLTPLGFVAERLRGPERRRAVWLGGALFVGVPALMLIGLLGGFVHGATSGWAPFGWAPLADHLPVFVPGFLLAEGAAFDLFRMVVYLQCMHYAAVLHVLPRLGGGEGARSQFRWPAPAIFRRVLFAAGVVTAVGFALSFRDARAVYGVFAALHAWLEVPVLLVALALPVSHRSFRAWASTRSSSA